MAPLPFMAGELLFSPASETPVRYEPQEARERGGGGERNGIRAVVGRKTVCTNQCGVEGK